MNVNEIYFNDNKYNVIYKTKRIKKIIIRFKDDTFYISMPLFSLKITAYKFLSDVGLKLIKKVKKSNTYDLENGYVFLYGKKYTKNIDGLFLINNNEYKIDNINDFYNLFITDYFHLLKSRVDYYKNIMNIPVDYKIHIKNVKTILGSNSLKTKSLTFSIILIHYPLVVIDSIVVHELAHYFYRNHSKNFYNVVYKYFPDYKKGLSIFKKGLNNGL